MTVDGEMMMVRRAYFEAWIREERVQRHRAVFWRRATLFFGAIAVAQFLPQLFR